MTHDLDRTNAEGVHSEIRPDFRASSSDIDRQIDQLRQRQAAAEISREEDRRDGVHAKHKLQNKIVLGLFICGTIVSIMILLWCLVIIALHVDTETKLEFAWRFFEIFIDAFVAGFIAFCAISFIERH